MECKNILIIILTVVGILFLAGCAGNATGATVVDPSGSIKIPLSELSEKAKFYEYDDDGVKISYFAVLGSDGKPRTAFDACDVCGGSKGYQQTGNDITCRNCGKVFSIDGLGTRNKGYGCWPSYLPHNVQGGDLLINVNDIKSGRHRFA
ncbi:MAG: DUF2318 domain-containing protein [Candidatus Woesearchaeota archaeon]